MSGCLGVAFVVELFLFNFEVECPYDRLSGRARLSRFSAASRDGLLMQSLCET